MTDLSELLDKAALTGALYSFNVVRSPRGDWQANLQETRGSSFYVCHGATPSEALAALFAEPLEVPACPV
jgi:hypothetical protein